MERHTRMERSKRIGWVLVMLGVAGLWGGWRLTRHASSPRPSETTPGHDSLRGQGESVVLSEVLPSETLPELARSVPPVEPPSEFVLDEIARVRAALGAVVPDERLAVPAGDRVGSRPQFASALERLVEPAGANLAGAGGEAMGSRGASATVDDVSVETLGGQQAILRQEVGRNELNSRSGHTPTGDLGPLAGARALRDAARRLEEVAAHLEDATRYAEADRLRTASGYLRSEARQLQPAPAEIVHCDCDES